MATVRSSRRSIKLPAAKSVAAGPAAKRAVPPTKEQLSEYRRIYAARQDAERAARSLKKAEEMLRDQIMPWMKQIGRTNATRLGFDVRIEQGNRYPSWKEEFIAVAGEQAAHDVIENTPPSERLIVE